MYFHIHINCYLTVYCKLMSIITLLKYAHSSLRSCRELWTILLGRSALREPVCLLTTCFCVLFCKSVASTTTVWRLNQSLR